MKHVLLVIDNPYRELRGMASIQVALHRRGISSVIASKTNYGLCYDFHRPHVVVLPMVAADMAPQAHRFATASHICLLPTEHSNGVRERWIANILRPDREQLFGPAATAKVAKAFLPGRIHRDILLEEKILREDQMVVTGTLNSDHWFLARHDRLPRRFSIGISTSNKSILFGTTTDSVLATLDRCLLQPWPEFLWRIDQAGLELAHMTILIEVLRHLSTLGCPIYARPHPHELTQNWHRFIHQSRLPITINRSLRLDEWLDSIGLCITTFSTVILDCFAHGIPAVSLDGILPPQFLERLPAMRRPGLSEFSWKPSSLDELYALVEQAKRGELAPTPHPEQAAACLRDLFHFPRQELACDMIADGITHLVETPLSHPSCGRHLSAKAKTKAIVGQIPLLPSALTSLVDIHTLVTNPRRWNLYYPFRLGLRRDAARYARKILATAPHAP